MEELESNKRGMLDDNELVELYFARDERAISETDRKYGGYLFSVAYNILHDDGDSEECRNDTYLGAWRAIPPERPSRLRAFLTVIMRRSAINRYNDRSRQKRIPSELTSSLDELGDIFTSEDSVERAVESSELAASISGYLRSASGRTRLIFVSRYYCSDKVSSIASMLGVTERTVYTELAKIRKDLADRLRKEGFI